MVVSAASLWPLLGAVAPLRARSGLAFVLGGWHVSGDSLDVAIAAREATLGALGALGVPAFRYGPLPDSMLNLAIYTRIRLMAERLGIETIDREDRAVVMKFRPRSSLKAWL